MLYTCGFFIIIRETSLKRVILNLGFRKAGQINVLEKMFDEKPEREVIYLGSLITCYVQNGYLEQA